MAAAFIPHRHRAGVIAVHVHGQRPVTREDHDAAGGEVRSQHVHQDGDADAWFEAQAADPAGARV